MKQNRFTIWLKGWPQWGKITAIVVLTLAVLASAVGGIVWLDTRPAAMQSDASSAASLFSPETTAGKTGSTGSTAAPSADTTAAGAPGTTADAVHTQETTVPHTTAGAAPCTNLFSAPDGIPASETASLRVNGEPCFVYDTLVNFRRRSPAGNAHDVLEREKTPVAVWETDGQNAVSITYAGATVRSAAVTPQALGITPEVEGDTVIFTIPGPGQYTVEINGSAHQACHLFVNPPYSPPAPGGNTLIYGPGVHEVGEVRLRSGQTVYLAGGAVVRGWFVGNGVSNVRIYGSGIVDGSIYPRYKADGVGSAAHPPIQFSNCTAMQLEGITFLDPAGWTVNTYHCTDVTVNRVNIISSRQNGDGITTQSCTNQTVTNCFVRSWDDSLVVKAYEGNVRDILFDSCILWTDLAQSCEVGFETRGDTMENITFQNVTVLHNYHKAVMSVHNGDHAVIRGVTFRNIVVEKAEMGEGDGWNYLFDLQVADTIWSKEDERGRIEQVTFDNIRVLAGRTPYSRLEGFDAAHGIDGVTFRDVWVLGRPVTDAKSGYMQINAFVKNVVFS